MGTYRYHISQEVEYKPENKWQEATSTHLSTPLRRSLLIEEITPRETDDTLLLRGLDRRTDSQ